MIILIGPSASGKTEIAKYLISTFSFNKFVTTTTRTPRIGEINGSTGLGLFLTLIGGSFRVLWLSISVSEQL